MARASNSKHGPILQTCVNCRPVTSVTLHGISARKHKVKPEKSSRGIVKLSSRKWPTKPTIKRKQPIPPQPTKSKCKETDVCSSKTLQSDDDMFAQYPSTSRVFQPTIFDCFPQSSRSLDNSRKSELATESYVDTRPLHNFSDSQDDHMWTNPKDGRKTVCAEKQMELDMAMLQQYGFESCFVDVKLTSDAKKIWSLYLIFLAAMLQKKFWACSCYKLMFALGVYDVCATFIGGTFCGILSIRGDVFCTNPTFVYLVGCLQASLWSGACITGLILLVNRVLDLANEAAASYFFAGSRTYIWFIFPFASFLYMWFYTTPFLFNAILDAAFLNPFSGISEIQIDILQYDNFYCRIHNYIIAAIYPFIYLVICVILWKKSKRGAIGSKQKQSEVTMKAKKQN
ncbi:serpentine type 7TM GPCR chemoreceptor srt domain-containing protein [Ditylenchus destructor]|uniref:Serpentine type 7TM GPCR chemoreceptor srt domain-containing protein n=1 Tax=Ditylenchus destructor TaxID=166010 RepID=A0AAD4MTD6_9BILA|nr:serpentine type 7TM GPCR chemoreceptor srt domain-containing protein [Ditylenchus destructor]